MKYSFQMRMFMELGQWPDTRLMVEDVGVKKHCFIN